MAGRFPEPVRAWEGATQGHEVTGLRHEGLKFETLGFGEDVLATRLPGVGRELARNVEERAHWVDWGAAIRSTARGRVRSAFGTPIVTWAPSELDITRYRRALRVLGDLMFAAGATWVSPGVRGFPERIDDPGELARLERDGPRHAAAYPSAITHMFGTCRAGSDPGTSVVRPDLRHHHLAGLYVADSSVFPSNTGVNPQIPIAAVAALCARHVLKELG
jgi:choline dehydrogenase-like flavoprotein